MKIIDLISQHFIANNYSVFGLRCEKFTCPFVSDCKVLIGEDPIWSPAFGDDNSKVMVIAEAPSYSKKWGAGPNIGGFVRDWGNEKDVNALFRFIKQYHGVYPYFTDLMKCGISRQVKEKKKVFRYRISNCVKQFLLKEIDYLQPEVIYSVGAESLVAINEYISKGYINKSIEVIPLLHYSKQANLPLNISDKEKIIWPFQANKLSNAKAVDLNFFKKNDAI